MTSTSESEFEDQLAKVAAKAKDISKKITEIYKRGTVQANRFPFLNLVLNESVWSTEK